MAMLPLSDDELHSMLEEREQARRSKDWDKADALREQLRAKVLVRLPARAISARFFASPVLCTLLCCTSAPRATLPRAASWMTIPKPGRCRTAGRASLAVGAAAGAPAFILAPSPTTGCRCSAKHRIGL